MPALATRCPECSTSFRVQATQLAASQGFVRCGRCDAVFDARLSLFDLNDGQPVAWSTEGDAHPAAPSAPEPALPPPEAGAAQRPADAAQGQEPTWQDDPAALQGSDPMPAETGPSERTEPAWQEPGWGEPTHAPADEAVPPGEVNDRLRALLGSDEPALAGAPASASAWSSLAPPPALGRPGRVSSALGWLAVAVLVLALPLQWAWVERAALRARSPGLDQLWRQLCPHCEAPAWAQIDGLRVGASSLQPTPQGQAYHLQLTLHNGASHTLALPWLDLRLQDAQGRVLVRRAVSPDEMGAKVDRLAAGGQLVLKGTFRIQSERSAAATISGYEIGLFHP